MEPAPLRRLTPQDRTIPVLLSHQAEQRPDQPLIRAGGLERSCAGARDAVAAAAGRLAAAGIERGDRVAIICGNRIELLDTVLACAWLGAIAVPLNTASRGRQLEHMLTNSGARILIVEPGQLEHLPAEPPPAIEQVWVLDDGAAARPPYPTGPVPPPADPVAAADVGPAETTAILYTSGTTGLSKGVRCPQAQFYWWGITVSEMLEIREGDVLHTCLPMFHTNALNAFTQALVAGGVYSFGSRFSASGFWEDLAASGATVTYLLGAMVSILWGRDPGPHDRSHSTRVALAPATAAPLMDGFRERFGVQLVEAYGSTETNCVLGAQPGEQRGGYMGYVRSDYEAQVVDSHDQPVEDGTPGELVLRSREPFSFATGYHEMDEKTVEAWRNLWFHTGDRVIREPDGWYRFLDRIKDAIRRRGENISSLEVEQVLLEHPDVETAAVFAVPAELGEDEVMATIVLRKGADADAEALMRHCEPRLAYFAIPRYLDFVSELPLTENGKIHKLTLRRRAVTESTWDREGAGYKLAR